MIKRSIIYLLSISILLQCTGCAAVPVKLEQNDWSSIWIEHANQDQLPRILFVGDSITDGFYDGVVDNLGDLYYPGWYTTSKFVSNPDFQDELAIILHRYHFEMIVLTTRIHGWEYSTEEYQKGLIQLTRLLERQAPEAALIWVLGSPMRTSGSLENLSPVNAQLIARNQAAAAVMAEKGVPVLDLYSAMISHPEYYRPDGIHFNAQGKAAQAELITRFILDNR